MHDHGRELSAAAGRVRVRDEHGVVPDRGGVRRGRQGPEHLGHLHRRARAGSWTAATARSPATTTTATSRTSRLMKRPRRRRLPLLDRLAADPARRQRPGQRSRASTSTTASSTSSSARASSRWRRSSTGTCRRRCRTHGAAGRSARPPSVRGVRRHLRRAARRPGRQVGAGQRAQRGHPARPRRSASTRPGSTLGFDALPVAHHLNLGTASRSRRCARTARSEVGTATNHAPVWAASDEPEDVAAADLFDVAVEPDLRRPDAARPLPRGLRRG